MTGDFVGGNRGFTCAVTGNKQAFSEVSSSGEETDVLRVQLTPERAGIKIVGFPFIVGSRRLDCPEFV